MELKSVDAALLQKAVLAAAKGLEAKKEWINELNVFPVPDGDTGTNMTMTIMAAAREVAAIENPTMESIAKALSSGSLRGAAVTPALSYPSYSAALQRRSRNPMRLP